MRKIQALFLLFFAQSFFGCEDESLEGIEDSTPPTISLTQPVGGLEFYPTQYVPVKATVTDETDLEQVIITVTGPGVENTYTRVHGEGGVEFFEDKVDNLDFTFLLPAISGPGNYIISLAAVDGMGNEAVEETVTIVVLEDDKEKPVVAVESPVENAVLSRGEVVEISASVTDNRRLRAVRVRLGRSGTLPLLDKTYNSFENVSNFVVNEQFAIPAGTPNGDYFVLIEGEDQKGNMESRTIPIEIIEATASE